MDPKKEATTPEERNKSYEKRATRRKIRALHNAIKSGCLSDVESMLAPDVDVNFHYGGQSALQIAVTEGHHDICELLIKHGADVNKTNTDDNSLLNMAAWRGYAEICQLLIDHEAEVETYNNTGCTPVASAANHGHTNVVRTLIQADCNLHRCDLLGRSPLVTAVSENHPATVAALLEGGCDINWPDHNRNTPLCTAATRGHSEIVKQLLACKDCDTDVQERSGCTALYMASHHGHHDIVNQLIQAGAKLDITDHRGVSPVLAAVRNEHLSVVKLLTAAGCDLNTAELDMKHSPIHTAVRQATLLFGRKDIYTSLVQTLVDAGCDLDTGDKEGYIPLFQAAFTGETEFVSLLLAHTKDLSVLTETGDSLVHGAVHGNKLEVLNIILDAGCSVNVVNKRNELPLYTAVNFRAKIELVSELVKQGSKLDVYECKGGNTPLFAAINNHYNDAVEILIKAGASVNLSNFNGDTPLWVACNRGNKAIVTSLLQQPKIDINAGISHIPLHSAAAHGYYDITEMLLKAGADVNKLTDLCVSALYLAAEANYQDVVELLVRYGGNPAAPSLVKIPAMCCRHYRDQHPHLELEPLYAAVKNDNFHVIKLLLIATPRMPYKVISTLRDLIFRTNFAQDARLSQSTIYQYASFFSTVLKKPNSLQVECRGVIRCRLGSRKQVSRVEKLPLPSKIKDFLLFKGMLKSDSTEES